MKFKTLLLLIFFNIGLFLSLFGQNGQLIDVKPKQAFSPEIIEQLINLQFGGEAPDFIIALAGIKYNVIEFEITYLTTFPDGSLGAASGQVSVPFIPTPGMVELPLASYLHGTITSNAEAPSVGGGLERIVGIAYASAGYIGASPDYLGFGSSELTISIHPYLDADTEASSAIDMLRATRQLVAQLGDIDEALGNITLNDQVFLTGYSQGGHSVVATQRAIEQDFKHEFNLETVVGGSGPYDLPGVQRKFVLNHPDYASPAFLPYFVLGQQQVRNDIANIPSDDIFIDPDFVEPLFFEKEKAVGQINLELDAQYQQWRNIFVESFLDGVDNQFFHPVNNALRANRLTNFAPETKTWLLFCTADEQVDYRNSIVAWFNYFIRGAGFNVKAVSLGPQSHGDCAPYAILVAKLLFDRKKETSGMPGAFTRGLPEDAPAKLDPEQYQRIKDIVEDRNLPSLEDWLIEAGLDELRAQLIHGTGYHKLALYPNPVVDYAILDHSLIETPIKAVTIHDLTGKLIKEVVPREDGVLIIDRNGLSSGKYIVNLTADKTYNLQMIVE